MSNEQMKSPLILNRLAFERIDFSRDVNIGNVPKEYEMNFTREIQVSQDQENFRVSLTTNIWAKDDDSFKLVITLVGFFFCNCEDEGLKKDMISKNAVAILFPYLRSQISLVTTQPNMLPITLQPVNIVGMFEEIDNQNNSDVESE